MSDDTVRIEERVTTSDTTDGRGPTKPVDTDGRGPTDDPTGNDT
jgi:hypothetical protein